MQKVTKSLEETKVLAREWVSGLALHSLGEAGATVVGLSGDLGSGKTSFVQGVAEALGVAEHVTSPTFILERIYQVRHDKFTKLIHIDCYRLDSAEEFNHLGLEEHLQDPATLILIEWPERVAGALPADMLTLNFKFLDDTTREISW